MKYSVKVRAVYSGTVTVEAESPAEAKEIIKNQCVICGGVNSVESPGRTLEFDFTAPVTVELGKAKNGEKQEEQQEEPVISMEV